MLSVPPTTKKRKAPSDEAEPVLPEKSSTFWFQDGNIVLQTPDKIYRIHRGVLGLHSTVFADMFALPQPDGELTVEGCAIVPVTDSTKDWDTLLGILYQTRKLYLRNTHTIALDAMLSMLRLGHKYNFEAMKNEALEQLKVIFPDSLDDWDELFCGDVPESTSNLTYGHEFEILNTIEELEIRTALPVAFYTCLRERTIEDIIDGRDAPDGPVYLSQITRNLLITGSHTLTKDYATEVFSWLRKRQPAVTCQCKRECANLIMDCLSMLLGKSGTHGALDPGTIFTRDKKFCPDCKKEGVANLNRGRGAIFARLPLYFGLPEWNELKDF